MNELPVRQYLRNDGSGFTFGYDKSEADRYIAYLKYKWCLAMADKCMDLYYKAKDLYRWAGDENLEHYYDHKIEFFARWRKRWLELAEKFKAGK